MNRAVQLQNYLDKVNGQEFTWDRANCCHFSGGWVEALTGTNPMAGLRATGSAFDAHKLISSLGGMVAATTRQLGVEPIDAKFAQLGDVVYVETPKGGAVGICGGRDVLLINSFGEMSRLDLVHATCAWRIQ